MLTFILKISKVFPKFDFLKWFFYLPIRRSYTISTINIAEVFNMPHTIFLISKGLFWSLDSVTQNFIILFEYYFTETLKSFL